MSVADDNEDAEIKALVDSSADLININDIEVDENDALHERSIFFLLVH